jgi:Ankyrin repeats (3 copies)/Ankyrin repeats (many copies)
MGAGTSVSHEVHPVDLDDTNHYNLKPTPSRNNWIGQSMESAPKDGGQSLRVGQSDRHEIIPSEKRRSFMTLITTKTADTAGSLEHGQIDEPMQAVAISDDESTPPRKKTFITIPDLSGSLSARPQQGSPTSAVAVELDLKPAHGGENASPLSSRTARKSSLALYRERAECKRKEVKRRSVTPDSEQPSQTTVSSSLMSQNSESSSGSRPDSSVRSRGSFADSLHSAGDPRDDLQLRLAYNLDGTLSLLRAAKENHLPSVIYVLEKLGKNVALEVKDKDGWTPLLHALSHGNVPMVGLLVAKGANVRARESRENMSALHFAAKTGVLPNVIILVKTGLDISVKDKNGQTPLHIAAMMGYLPIVDYLLENGAKIDAVNNAGETPLIVAVIYGHLPLVRHLASKKADVNFPLPVRVDCR